MVVVIDQRATNSFPISTFMNNKKIVAVETFNATQVSKSPNGESVVSASDAAMGFLTLDVGGNQNIQQLPLQSLNVAVNGGHLREFDNLVINQDKCFVSFSTPSELTAGEAVLINFYYTD